MTRYIQTTRTQNIGRIVLGLFMVMAGTGHLSFLRAASQAQVPDWIPVSKDLVVILSGIVELGLGLSMIFWKKERIWVGIALAIYYILIFPGNIAQYVDKTDALNLHTDNARLIRLFFQPLLIIWALWSTGALQYLFHRKVISVTYT